MKVDDLVILVGGRGSRINKFTSTIPKPLISIGKKPFLDQLISNKLKYDFKRIFLLCSFKKNIFFKRYHNKYINNTKLICIDEGSRKDTGGALYKVKRKIKKDFILVNGDTFFDFDIYKLVKQKLHNRIGIMCLTKIKKKYQDNKIDNLDINRANDIYFSKKKTNIINGGIYLFNKKIFNFIKNKKQSLENEILKDLINENKIKGLLSDRNFIDIGSYTRLKYLRNDTSYIKNKAFFLDRDGVINKDNGYVLKYSKFFFLNGVKKTIKYINDKNYLVIILTNQAAIGKGLMNEKALHLIHQKMKKDLLRNNNAKVDDIYFAPYFKGSKLLKYRLNKNDRKPNIGMFKKAIDKWNIDINKSFYIGDKKTDYLASKKVKIKFFYKDRTSLYNQITNII